VTNTRTMPNNAANLPAHLIAHINVKLAHIGCQPFKTCPLPPHANHADLKKRHFYTRLTEFFSTKLIGFNKTSGKGLNFFSKQLVKDIAAGNNMSCVEIDTSKYTSNIIYILKKNDAVLSKSDHQITVNSSDE